jgi:iron complex outermembrane receptor protein
MLARRRVLSIGAALLSQLWISGASAQEPQTTPPPTPPATEPAPPPAAPEPAAPAPAAPVEEVVPPAAAAPAAGKRGEQTEEIVVTGTRIRRKDLTTPAPVTVINRDAITSSGKVSIGDFLQALPEQGNAINTSVNNGGDGATRVSLRNLKAERTLVLINGRRMVAGGTGADLSPDLNSIPTAVIERVEVLKDGASAIYGSDAIAGVVNLITRRNFNGTDANVYLGDSSHDDAGTLDLNVTTGT